MRSGGTYQACTVSCILGACRQLDLFSAVLESAQFFHHALGFANFVREHEQTGDKITTAICNLQDCCNNPALLVEQLEPSLSPSQCWSLCSKSRLVAYSRIWRLRNARS